MENVLGNNLIEIEENLNKFKKIPPELDYYKNSQSSFNSFYGRNESKR